MRGILGKRNMKDFEVLSTATKVAKVSDETETDGVSVPSLEQRIPNTRATIGVHTLAGRKLQFVAALSESVQYFKQRITAKEGIPVDIQRLIFAGKQLEDERTLADYKISDGSIINLVLRLRGGMYHPTSGFSDTDGEFEYSTISLNGLKVPVHPAWTADEIVTNISESIQNEDPVSSLAKRFRRTAISMRNMSFKEEKLDLFLK